MADSAALCPNCRMAWPEGASLCPNCGYVASPAPPSWPPPPSIFRGASQSPPEPKLVTGKLWGDLTLGIGISFASNFVACVGFLIMPILYFMLRPNYPVFARGIGYGIVAGLTLLLGAVVWCFAGLANFHF